MSISDTVSQTAATDPYVGVAVASAQTQGAILAGLQSGDTSIGSLLGSTSTQAQVTSQLLASLDGGLGRNVDLLA